MGCSKNLFCISAVSWFKLKKIRYFWSIQTYIWTFLFCQGFTWFKIIQKVKNYASSFYRLQNVLCRSKFFESTQKIWLHLVPLQNLLYQHKNQFYWMQIIFWSGTKCLWLAQNILGPVKGQGIKVCTVIQIIYILI